MEWGTSPHSRQAEPGLNPRSGRPSVYLIRGVQARFMLAFSGLKPKRRCPEAGTEATEGKLSVRRMRIAIRPSGVSAGVRQSLIPDLP